tara:strand:- start:716 stop:1279 length:564 start_codon:yes stop_codon:yes gene_type:complete
MAKKTLVIKQEVLEELILSTCRLQNAVAKVIEGSIDEVPTTTKAIEMKRAEKEEVVEGKAEPENPAPTDAEEKLTTEKAVKAKEARVRYAKEKKAEAPKKEEPKKEEPKKEEPKKEENKKEEPKKATVSEEEKEATAKELKDLGTQLFRQDRDEFLRILKVVDGKNYMTLSYDKQVQALALVKEAVK